MAKKEEDFKRVNAHRDFNITGDIEKLDMENFHGEFFPVGGSVNPPFNIDEVKNLKGLSGNFLDGKDLQSK